MNKCIFIGNLSKDVELSFAKSSSTAIGKFGLALQRQKKDDPADFINCIAFGKTAETIANYLSKGSKVALECRVQTGSYDAKDGTKRYTTDFIVDRFEFIGVAAKTENNNKKSFAGASFEEDFTPVDDGDMPF